MDTLSIGIDVSKDRLDVAMTSAQMAPVFVARNHDGLIELVERLRGLKVEEIGVEATGGFETVVAAALAAASLPVVVNLAQVRAYAKALGWRAKTDRIDAAVIAAFAAATRPPVRPLPDADTEALADLVARRRQIIAMIGVESQRLKRASARTARSIRRLLTALGRNWPISTRTSTTASAARRTGWRRSSCLPRCRGSATGSPARCSPNCPRSAGWIAGRWRP